tara:strand:- start:132 stop:1082 length:951 start_codon:yes stop_codon:yes gene_type:complete
MLENTEIQPKFCSDCGLSLEKLNAWCSSRECGKCGKEVFYVRRAEGGGIKVEKGEKFHMPSLTLSLDPSDGGQFTRYGLESFIKQIFLEEKLTQEEFVEQCKQLEKKLDKELSNLDCIQHCDFETDEGVSEALDILEKEGLNDRKFTLLRSGSLRHCYTSIESGDALSAAFSSYHAETFKTFAMLEHYHLKEIIWLGYSCYVDQVKNSQSTHESVKEKRLITGLQPKIKSLSDEILFAFSNDEIDIAPRLGIQGVSEKTIKSLLEHELQKRANDKEQIYKDQELELKKKANTIKYWGFAFTLINGLILAFYKNWLG